MKFAHARFRRPCFTACAACFSRRLAYLLNPCIPAQPPRHTCATYTLYRASPSPRTALHALPHCCEHARCVGLPPATARIYSQRQTCTLHACVHQCYLHLKGEPAIARFALWMLALSTMTPIASRHIHEAKIIRASGRPTSRSCQLVGSYMLLCCAQRASECLLSVCSGARPAHIELFGSLGYFELTDTSLKSSEPGKCTQQIVLKRMVPGDLSSTTDSVVRLHTYALALCCFRDLRLCIQISYQTAI